MYQLQKSVIIDNLQFNIRNDGDFRMVLDCFKALTDETMGEDLRVLASLLIFYNELDCYADLYKYNEEIARKLVEEMYRFFNCGQDKSPGVRTDHNLIDWEKDEQIVCASINAVANQEVRALPYVHWWTFMGYYMGVGESVLSTIVSIRDKIVRHKKLEKWEQEFKRNNPEYFNWKSTSVKDREVENLVRELWNQGGDK